MCDTRSDISFLISQLGRHNSDPKVDNMQIAKQMVYYLKCNTSLSLYYENKTKVLRYKVYRYNLVCYVDSNYTDDPKDKNVKAGYLVNF